MRPDRGVVARGARIDLIYFDIRQLVFADEAVLLFGLKQLEMCVCLNFRISLHLGVADGISTLFLETVYLVLHYYVLVI